MAVLKSPRNNKNKKRWSKLYALSFSSRPLTVPKWVDSRSGYTLYRQVSFSKVVENLNSTHLGVPVTPRRHPFVQPTPKSPLPCNTHFQNLTNTNRVFNPLIFSNIV